MLLLVLTLMVPTVTNALEVIGGRTTTVQGGAAVLPCKLIDTTETLTQISWQRLTRGKPRTDNFYTISSGGPNYINGHDYRFEYIGSFTDKNGTLLLSNVTLMDEGTYTCMFTLFPSGIHETAIPLKVHVPPVTSLKDAHPALGNDEVPLITCTAAGSKPPAEVRWLTGTLGEKVRPSTNSNLHANGTTTTVSWLFGAPTRELDDRSVQCVITSPALEREETLTSTIHIHSPPLEVNITERSAHSFECLTEAYPAASFTWTRSEQSWPQSGVRVDGSTLQFLSITSELNGLYQCEASNLYGSKRAYLRVHFTSGSSAASWTLFVLLLVLVVAAVLCCFYKRMEIARFILREEGGTRGKMQKVPTTSSSPDGHDRVEEGGETEVRYLLHGMYSGKGEIPWVM
ncbi:nectin-4-like isoform X1 [Labrus mixtus]|uniref:nectin-4-like isoform X1 n=1 Tax=Labrus mixtus TaxID=508554 RepID=UPI0029C07DEB|nr:nectin-4-like isoform X1 [Labrus mixtus]